MYDFAPAMTSQPPLCLPSSARAWMILILWIAVACTPSVVVSRARVDSSWSSSFFVLDYSISSSNSYHHHHHDLHEAKRRYRFGFFVAAAAPTSSGGADFDTLVPSIPLASNAVAFFLTARVTNNSVASSSVYRSVLSNSITAAATTSSLSSSSVSQPGSYRSFLESAFGPGKLKPGATTVVGGSTDLAEGLIAMLGSATQTAAVPGAGGISSTMTLTNGMFCDRLDNGGGVGLSPAVGLWSPLTAAAPFVWNSANPATLSSFQLGCSTAWTTGLQSTLLNHIATMVPDAASMWRRYFRESALDAASVGSPWGIGAQSTAAGNDASIFPSLIADVPEDAEWEPLLQWNVTAGSIFCIDAPSTPSSSTLGGRVWCRNFGALIGAFVYSKGGPTGTSTSMSPPRFCILCAWPQSWVGDVYFRKGSAAVGQSTDPRVVAGVAAFASSVTSSLKTLLPTVAAISESCYWTAGVVNSQADAATPGTTLRCPIATDVLIGLCPSCQPSDPFKLYCCSTLPLMCPKSRTVGWIAAGGRCPAGSAVVGACSVTSCDACFRRGVSSSIVSWQYCSGHSLQFKSESNTTSGSSGTSPTSGSQTTSTMITDIVTVQCSRFPRCPPGMIILEHITCDAGIQIRCARPRNGLLQSPLASTSSALSGPTCTIIKGNDQVQCPASFFVVRMCLSTDLPKSCSDPSSSGGSIRYETVLECCPWVMPSFVGRMLNAGGSGSGMGGRGMCPMGGRFTSVMGVPGRLDCQGMSWGVSSRAFALGGITVASLASSGVSSSTYSNLYKVGTMGASLPPIATMSYFHDRQQVLLGSLTDGTIGMVPPSERFGATFGVLGVTVGPTPLILSGLTSIAAPLPYTATLATTTLPFRYFFVAHMGGIARVSVGDSGQLWIVDSVAGSPTGAQKVIPLLDGGAITQPFGEIIAVVSKPGSTRDLFCISENVVWHIGVSLMTVFAGSGSKLTPWGRTSSVVNKGARLGGAVQEAWEDGNTAIAPTDGALHGYSVLTTVTTNPDSGLPLPLPTPAYGLMYSREITLVSPVALTASLTHLFVADDVLNVVWAMPFGAISTTSASSLFAAAGSTTGGTIVEPTATTIALSGGFPGATIIAGNPYRSSRVVASAATSSWNTASATAPSTCMGSSEMIMSQLRNFSRNWNPTTMTYKGTPASAYGGGPTGLYSGLPAATRLNMMSSLETPLEKPTALAYWVDPRSYNGKNVAQVPRKLKNLDSVMATSNLYTTGTGLEGLQPPLVGSSSSTAPTGVMGARTGGTADTYAGISPEDEFFMHYVTAVPYFDLLYILDGLGGCILRIPIGYSVVPTSAASSSSTSSSSSSTASSAPPPWIHTGRGCSYVVPAACVHIFPTTFAATSTLPADILNIFDYAVLSTHSGGLPGASTLTLSPFQLWVGVANDTAVFTAPVDPAVHSADPTRGTMLSAAAALSTAGAGGVPSGVSLAAMWLQMRFRPSMSLSDRVSLSTTISHRVSTTVSATFTWNPWSRSLSFTQSLSLTTCKGLTPQARLLDPVTLLPVALDMNIKDIVLTTVAPRSGTTAPPTTTTLPPSIAAAGGAGSGDGVVVIDANALQYGQVSFYVQLVGCHRFNPLPWAIEVDPLNMDSPDGVALTGGTVGSPTTPAGSASGVSFDNSTTTMFPSSLTSSTTDTATDGSIGSTTTRTTTTTTAAPTRTTTPTGSPNVTTVPMRPAAPYMIIDAAKTADGTGVSVYGIVRILNWSNFIVMSPVPTEKSLSAAQRSALVAGGGGESGGYNAWSNTTTLKITLGPEVKYHPTLSEHVLLIIPNVHLENRPKDDLILHLLLNPTIEMVFPPGLQTVFAFIISITLLFSILGRSSLTAMRGGRLQFLLRTTQCPLEDVATPLDIGQSPLGLTLGTGKYRYHIGAVVGNTAILLFVVLIYFVVGAVVFAIQRFRMRRLRLRLITFDIADNENEGDLQQQLRLWDVRFATYGRTLRTLHFPSFLFPIFFLYLQPTLTSALKVIINGQQRDVEQGERSISSVVLFVVLLLLGYLIYLFLCDFDGKTKTTRSSNTLLVWVRGPLDWVDIGREGQKGFCQKYGSLFVEYVEPRFWYFFVEFSFLLIIAAGDSPSMSNPTRCFVSQVVLSLLLCANLLGFVILQPMQSQLKSRLIIMTSIFDFAAFVIAALSFNSITAAISVFCISVSTLAMFLLGVVYVIETIVVKIPKAVKSWEALQDRLVGGGGGGQQQAAGGGVKEGGGGGGFAGVMNSAVAKALGIEGADAGGGGGANSPTQAKNREGGDAGDGDENDSELLLMPRREVKDSGRLIAEEDANYYYLPVAGAPAVDRAEDTKTEGTSDRNDTPAAAATPTPRWHPRAEAAPANPLQPLAHEGGTEAPRRREGGFIKIPKMSLNPEDYARREPLPSLPPRPPPQYAYGEDEYPEEELDGAGINKKEHDSSAVVTKATTVVPLRNVGSTTVAEAVNPLLLEGTRLEGQVRALAEVKEHARMVKGAAHRARQQELWDLI